MRSGVCPRILGAASGLRCIASGPPPRPQSESTRSGLGTVYSHSRLSNFETCPKRFHYRYVLRIPADTESIEAFMGKRVHEVLERLNRFLADGRIPSVEKVVQRFHRLWDEHYDPERVRIVRREIPADFYQRNGERYKCRNR